MNKDLKVGDRVRSPYHGEGEVVGILTRTNKVGMDLVIITDDKYQSLYMRFRNGDGFMREGNRGPDFVKIPKIVKGTVYLNIYADGFKCVHDTVEKARKSSKTYVGCVAVAIPVNYEYEVNDE